MKLLMATHYFESHRGGIEIVAGKLAEGLKDKNCEVVWIAADVTAPPEGPTEIDSRPLATWNVVESLCGLPFPIPKLGAIRQIYQAVARSEVILLHDCLYLSNIITFLRAKRLQKPVIITQHIGLVPYRNPLLRTLMKIGNVLITRQMLASADQVVFISQNTARHFSTVRFNNPPQLIFNGVDTATFRSLTTDETKASLRRLLGLPQDRSLLLFVGRFVSKKGLGAIKRMAELRPDLLWVLAGWGPIDPKEWALENVRTFSNLRGQSLASLYRACDLLVLPSTGEGLPLVVQEALACGLPVICGEDTADADSEMKGHVSAATVCADEFHTARNFLAAAEQYLNPENSSKDLSSKLSSFAQSRYSWNQAVDRYMRLLLQFRAQKAATESRTSRKVDSTHASS